MNIDNERLVATLKVVAEPTRLRILALCAQAECAVSELTKILGLSQPRVSQHLKALCDAELLQRFRDGQFVYYRAVVDGGTGRRRRQVMALLHEDPVFETDLDKLRALRADLQGAEARGASHEDRLLYRYLLDLGIAAPLGDLLDIGCGRGDILKLLAARANRAVGVDIDPSARRLARAELLTAGVPNCSLRQGDMYALPFEAQSFDTVILDDILSGGARPVDALREALRVVRPHGRIVLLVKTSPDTVPADSTDIAGWCAQAGLRLAAPRPVPAAGAQWLFAVATSGRDERAAA